VGVGTAAKSLGLPEWDRSRGWLWNIMRQIFGMGDFSN